jgi:PD-(D/E)XK endonuclease
MGLRQANPRRQGDLGELAAIEWFGRKGYGIWTPLFHSRDIDLIVDHGPDLYRVQVKTSTYLRRDGVYEVKVCTHGGNQSWNGLVKRLDTSLIDYLFVLVADGRRWLIPATAVTATTTIIVGRTKYAEYEVEPWLALSSASTPVSADPQDRGDAEPHS